MQLYIGNKNYSSWSMRPWVLMQACGIPFEEVALRLNFQPDSDFKRAVAQVSPAGRVPVLVDDGLAVWDTLAIVEYLAERQPDAGLWPADQRLRARARSLCAEMHGGFSALRTLCPMNIEARLEDVGQRLWAQEASLRADLERVDTMWCEQIAACGGPFLFGVFCAADAFFAPVCMRVRTYGLPVSPQAAAYIERMVAHPAVQAWISDALAEQDFLAEDEPYRTQR